MRMAEHEDDICVLENDEEPHDTSAFYPALCNPHLNPVAAPPELASHHALSSAYTTLKARYNDLEDKYKSMSRSFNDLNSSKRIRPSSSSSDQTMDMAFAASAESESGPESRAKAGYVQYLERELHKIKIELQTSSMIQSSLEEKLKYWEEKNKSIIRDKDSVQCENDRLKVDIDKLLEKTETLEEQSVKSQAFDEMKLKNMQKDFENEKLKLRQDADHWRREYEKLENAPPVVGCRKCAENEKKFLKLQANYQKLLGSVPQVKTTTSGHIQITLTENEHKEFLKLKDVTAGLKKTVLNQRDAIHLLLRTNTVKKDGKLYATSMPARLPSRAGEENVEYISKPHKIPLPSVSEHEPLTVKIEASTGQRELYRNLVPITHPVSKPAFSDPVSPRNVRYTPEVPTVKTSPLHVNMPPSSASQFYSPNIRQIDEKQQEMVLNRHTSEHHQNPVLYDDNYSRKTSNTTNTTVTSSGRTNHYTGSSLSNNNGTDFVVVDKSQTIPFISEGNKQPDSDIPDYMRAGFIPTDVSDYVRLKQHIPGHPGNYRINEASNPVVPDCPRKSCSSGLSEMSDSHNSTSDVFSRRTSESDRDTRKNDLNLLEHPTWSGSNSQPVYQDPFKNIPELPQVVEAPRGVEPIEIRSDNEPVSKNNDSSSSLAYICPVCSIDFSYLSLDEFQRHVFDCFEQCPDSEQQTLQPEADMSFSNRVCPMCDSKFSTTTPQEEFEKHVNGHFDLDFQVI